VALSENAAGRAIGDIVGVLKSLKASQYEEGGPMQGTAFILIRSVVANPDDRETFDRWYGTDHLPLIFSKVPEVRNNWRFWSRSDPTVHYSLGEFPSMNDLQRAASSEGFKHVIADYDRTWGPRVTRTRDIMEKVQHFSR
jgi:hypothetical protein